MAFCAENIESACGDNFLGFDRDIGLHRGEHLVPSCFEFLWIFSRVEPSLVEFGHSNEFGISAEHDVGATTRHVGGNRHSTQAPGLCDNCRFARVVLCVEHLVLDPALGQQFRKVLALLDRNGSHQYGLPLRVTRCDVLDNLSVLRGLGGINQVGLVDSYHRAVGRNHHNIEFVGRRKLGGFSFGGSCHSRQFLVEAEIVLQRHGCQRLVFGLDLDAFFCLDGLVNTFVVPTTRQNSPGVFVDDGNFAIHDDVVLVSAEQFLRLDRIVQERNERGVGRFVKIVNTEIVLYLGNSVLQNAYGSLFLVEFIVDISNEFLGNFCKFTEPSVRLV